MTEQEISKTLELIQARNKKVEQDKAWEISWTRKLLIASITYVIASIWLWAINESNTFLKAVVPTAGYLLSTISIPYIKTLWINSHK